MTNTKSYEKELNSYDYEQLTTASDKIWVGMVNVGVVRYSFYRRRGHCPADALAYALVWCRNATEQKERRRSHETGYAAV